jgi:hypothetical protein
MTGRFSTVGICTSEEMHGTAHDWSKLQYLVLIPLGTCVSSLVVAESPMTLSLLLCLVPATSWWLS